MKGENEITQYDSPEITRLKKRILEQETSKSNFAILEEALKDSEHKYQKIFENANEAIFIAQDGKMVFFNPATIALGGYTEEEYLSRPFIEFIHPDDRNMVAERHFKRLQGEKIPDIYCFRIIHKDGNPKWLELKTVMITWMGRPATLNFMSDITESLMTQEALRQQEERFRSLIESLQDMIFTVDNNGQIVFESPSATRVLGYEPGYFIGKSPLVHIHPDDIDQALKDLGEVQNGVNDGLPTTLRHKRADGRWVYLETIGSNHLLTPGINGLVITARDVTARKQAEDALRASEERFRALSENALDIIYTMNLEGAITYANPSWRRILGHAPEELLGRYFTDFAREEDRKTYRKLFKRIRDEGAVINNHIGVMPAKDGTERVLNMNSAFNRDSQGRIIGVVGSMKDITEQREMEKKLYQAQKMEAIGTLAGGIAHDFNNLLMGIQGYASLMLLELEPSHPHYERIRRIEEQVKNGADLTRQLLGFARSGRYETKPTNINEIIARTSSIFGRTKKEIIIHRNLAQDLWTVDIDQGQIEQALMNLYLNAWQAMPGGGELCLETANVLRHDDASSTYSLWPGKYVKISISDTGTGMDEKTQQRIFDPFFTTKAMGRGTGLGLAMVYGIINGHKGSIEVKSELGRGATFEIYLPATEKTVVSDQKASMDIFTGTETILLVDDEQMVLEVTKELLESLGYRVYAAGSGQEAVAVYMEKRHEIDLVILDMIMPGISGGETFERLRDINPQLRVLLSSGYSIKGQAQQILAKGCNGFLQKPFHLELLSQKVREILNGRHA